MNKWLFISIVLVGFLNWSSDGWIFSSLASLGATSMGSSAYDEENTVIKPLRKEDVTLYSTQWCGYCKKTRAFLRNKGIDYVEYDIEKSAEGRQQYDSLEGNGVPLLVVESEIIRGYNTRAIMNAISE